MWVHKLSEIDSVSMKAVCSNCGPVRIRRRVPSAFGRKSYFQCQNARRRQSGGRGYEYREHKAAECFRCGFIPEHSRQLDVHHRNGNHRDDRVENLVTLCANCHRLQLVGLLEEKFNLPPS